MLSSVIGKILDNIIFCKHAELLKNSHLQLGLKPNRSATLCTVVLEEVVNFYVDNHSSCLIVLLNAFKSFDSIQYVKLFRLLIEKCQCPLLCKVIIFVYTNQALRVKWNNPFSPSTLSRYDIKQGGALSPSLFCIYMDELLGHLESLEFGCLDHDH